MTVETSRRDKARYQTSQQVKSQVVQEESADKQNLPLSSTDLNVHEIKQPLRNRGN